ncbi:DEAD/DEAH box helicase family protein [Spirochaeta lutea]|uniref:Helicase ATP-binding domain-containing protein n=1 Tax=Spirochaeta lutea TaxID=1480694 RepID=A0A098R0K2_9SPIO|nr:DEAD/DEAH box helicase family protein [Spirochaeta lutea]KGE73281.1 hypothetical protein DC28_04755 [Spirochaeta lutea]
MAIDFNKITSKENENTAINPKDIFNLLPGKISKYSYLRDIQAEVLESWFVQKENATNIVKMNTGSGKTLIGLLILKSSINEGKGPAVYIVPDNFLLNQVSEEANNLGIEITTDPSSIRFRRNKSILITNVHRLFNGKSIFGIGNEGIKIEIGTLLIDDAHACIEKIEDQFTISIPNSFDIYNEIFNLLKDDLKKQSPSIVADIENATPYTNIQVPFWSIHNKSDDLYRILLKASESDEIKFHLPLLKNSIGLCDCIITSEKIEFSIRVTPINIFNSYSACQRKIIMSATLPDDSTLVTNLGISIEDIDHSISPKSASDIGERLILVPQELDNSINKNDIKAKITEIAKEINVVIIVPSFWRSRFWNDVAHKIVSAENIDEAVDELKSKHCGITVLVNKYDGIDLPQDACRLLIIDELPDERREIDKIDLNLLGNNTSILRKKIQKIEQGMGRGIRSNEDYCAVMLIGDSLVNHLYMNNAIDYFTPGTKAQFDLSEKISEQIRDKGIDEIISTINLLINRNKEWISANKQALVHSSYNKGQISEIAICLRNAYDQAEIRGYREATDIVQAVVNNMSASLLRGWLKYYLAKMMDFQNSVEAQLIMKNAIKENRKLPVPEEGIEYLKLENLNNTQAKTCHDFLMEFSNKNHIILKVNAILDDLIFLPDTSNRFEEALKNIAYYIGFSAQRPESEFKSGPDDLWSLGDLTYLVIECKNGAETDLINKHDCNQLNGSINWFRREYDSTCKFLPLMIHPSTRFHNACSPHEDIQIITSEKLEKLKKNIRAFIKAITSTGVISAVEEISRALITYKLTKDLLMSHYPDSFSISK